MKGKRSDLGLGGPLHAGRHAADYGTEVSRRIVAAERAGGKEAVYAELRMIRDDIFEGKLPLY
jgi:hypothetical protein